MNYQIIVIPEYPPKYLEFQIFYSRNENESISILEESMHTLVTTTLDITQTQIIGADLIGKKVDEPIEFKILLRDLKGYCFESSQVVKARLTGPFADSELYSNAKIDALKEFDITLTGVETNATGSESEDEEIQKRQGYPCMKYYEFAVEKETLQSAGFYRLDALLEVDGTWQAVTSVKSLRMQAGATSAQHSVISIPSRYNQGTAPISMPVNQTMVLHVSLHDKFKNAISENTTDTVELQLSDFERDKEYFENVTNMNNGTYKVELTIIKTRKLVAAELVVGAVKINWDMVRKLDCPEVIYFTPGDCVDTKITEDNKDAVTKIDVGRYDTEQLTVGIKHFFVINCYDEFSNPLTSGGDNFTVTMTGKKLPVVGSDRVSVQVTDLGSGSYEASFTVSWAGTYQTSVMLAGTPYAQPFNL